MLNGYYGEYSSSYGKMREQALKLALLRGPTCAIMMMTEWLFIQTAQKQTHFTFKSLIHVVVYIHVHVVVYIQTTNTILEFIDIIACKEVVHPSNL